MKVDKNTSAKTTTPANSKKTDTKNSAAETAKTQLVEKAKTTKAAKSVEKTPQPEEPAVVVSVAAREPTAEELAQPKTYSPKELRSKAKAFLESGNMPPEQKAVLAEIVKKQEDEEKAAIKKKIHG